MRQPWWSWSINKRMPGSICPRHSERGNLSTYNATKWKTGCAGCLSSSGLAPATCNRILAVFKMICSLAVMRAAFCPQDNHRARVSPPSKSTRSENAISLGMRRGGSCVRWKKATERKPLPAACFCWPARSKAKSSRCAGNTSAWTYGCSPSLSKFGKPRLIPLSDEAITVSRSIPRQQGNPWLFPGHAPGKPLSDLYLFWNSLRCNLGLTDVRIHDLRHTFVSFLVKAGHSLYEV